MNAMTWVLALAGIILGFTIGWARSRTQLAGAVTRAQYDALMQENTALATKLEAAEGERGKATEYHERALKAEVTVKSLELQLKNQQEQLKSEFKNTATGILEEISRKFTAQSEVKIGDMLNPMKERLIEFKTLVGESFSKQRNEQINLQTEIQKIVLQADSLTKALRGDVKAQGNWGEVMLERILEASGLQKGIGYIIQGTEMGLTGTDGNRLRPDVIVNLPENKHIIIDSKVSLVAYDRYCGATDELTRDVQLKEFLRSVRAHVSGLSGKNYPDIKELGTPELVLLFMPIEGAFSLAVQQDQELHPYAWDKRVAIVCPSTLVIALKTIASLWRIEKQNKYAEEIAKRGGALYDKFMGFIEDMQGIGTKVTALQKDYDGAMNKLSQGQGNLIRQVEELKKLGAKTSKPLPKGIVVEEDMPSLAVAEN